MQRKHLEQDDLHMRGVTIAAFQVKKLQGKSNQMQQILKLALVRDEVNVVLPTSRKDRINKRKEIKHNASTITKLTLDELIEANAQQDKSRDIEENVDESKEEQERID